MAERSSGKVAVAAVVYVPMLLLALAINSIAGEGSMFWAIPSPIGPGGLQLAAAVTLAAVVLLSGPFLARRFPWARELEREFRRALGRLSGVEIAAMALLSSVAEEALFRGALQPLLTRIGGGSVVVGVLASSAIFALAHPPLKKELRPWTAFAFVLGLFLGALYAWEPANLLAPITTHFLINFVNLHRITRIDLDDRPPARREPATELGEEEAQELEEEVEAGLEDAVFEISDHVDPSASSEGSDEDEMAAKSDD